MIGHRIRTTVAAITLTLTSAAWGQGATIVPDFRDADFSLIAQSVSQSTGHTVSIGPGVCALISARWENPLTPEEFYQAFISIARAMGYTVVERGSATEITLDANASSRSCRKYPVVS